MADVVRLSQPANGQWVMARVASLLVDYYAPDVPASIISMAAADWADELGCFPDWAIDRAVRWWKSAENPDRRKKPLPGDIAIRARNIMGPVFVAERAVLLFDQGKVPWVPPKPYEPPDRETGKRDGTAILQAAGFGVRKMEHD